MVVETFPLESGYTSRTTSERIAVPFTLGTNPEKFRSLNRTKEFPWSAAPTMSCKFPETATLPAIGYRQIETVPVGTPDAAVAVVTEAEMYRAWATGVRGKMPPAAPAIVART